MFSGKLISEFTSFIVFQKENKKFGVQPVMLFKQLLLTSDLFNRPLNRLLQLFWYEISLKVGFKILHFSSFFLN